MITVTIAQLLNSIDVLQKLAKMQLKAKLAWSVARLLKAADAEIQDFNNTRLDLIRKYGEKDENEQLITDENGNCKIKPDEISNFTNELTELTASEIEINANKIHINDIENLDFTPTDMAALETFIDFDE